MPSERQNEEPPPPPLNTFPPCLKTRRRREQAPSPQVRPVDTVLPTMAKGTTASTTTQVDPQRRLPKPSAPTSGAVPLPPRPSLLASISAIRPSDQQQQPSQPRKQSAHQKRITISNLTEARSEGGAGAQNNPCAEDHPSMRHCTCAPVSVLNADGTRVIMPSCFQLPNLSATPAIPPYSRQRGVYDQQQGPRYHPYQRQPPFQRHYTQHQPLLLSYSTLQPNSLLYQDSHYRTGMYSNHLPHPDPILPEHQRWGRDQPGFRPAYQRQQAFQPPYQYQPRPQPDQPLPAGQNMVTNKKTSQRRADTSLLQ